jgi:hypothetical protein
VDIPAALQTWRANHIANKASPDGEPSEIQTSGYTAEQDGYWKEIDAAEKVICQTEAKSHGDVIAKLLLTLSHSGQERWIVDAVIAGDMAALAASAADLDWPDRFILSAIQSLEKLSSPTTPPGQLSEHMSKALRSYIFTRDTYNHAPAAITHHHETMLGAAYMTARSQLIGTPASSIDDFRTKFDVMLLDPAATPSRADVLLLFKDLQRIASTKVSPIFNPDCWVKWFERRGGGWVARQGEVLFLIPPSGDADYCMEEMEAAGACELVKGLLLARSEMTEAHHG